MRKAGEHGAGFYLGILMTKRHIGMFLEEFWRREKFHRNYQRGGNNKVRIQRDQETWDPEPREVCFPRAQR